MSFKYKSRSPDQLQKRAEQTGGGDFQGFIADDFKTFTPKKGDNWIRILPPTWDDAPHYGVDVHVHYGIGPERASVICTARQEHPTEGTKSRCSICDARARAEKMGDEELAKELRVTKRVLVWILDMKEQDKGPLIWAMPWSVDRDIVKICRDKRTGEIFVIDHPDAGYDVTFEKEGEREQTKYNGFQLMRKPSSVSDEWLDYITEAPLPFCVRWRDSDEVDKLFQGMMDGDVDPRDRPARAEKPAERGASRRDAPVEDAAPVRRRPLGGEAQAARTTREENIERNADIDAAPRRRAAPPVEESDDEPPARTTTRRAPAREPEPEPEEEARPVARRAAPREDPPFDPDPEPAPRAKTSDNAAALRERFAKK